MWLVISSLRVCAEEEAAVNPSWAASKNEWNKRCAFVACVVKRGEARQARDVWRLRHSQLKGHKNEQRAVWRGSAISR